ATDVAVVSRPLATCADGDRTVAATRRQMSRRGVARRRGRKALYISLSLALLYRRTEELAIGVKSGAAVRSQERRPRVERTPSSSFHGLGWLARPSRLGFAQRIH